MEAYLTAVNLEALAREGLAPHEEQALAALQAAAAAAAPPVTTGAQLYDQLNNVHVLTTVSWSSGTLVVIEGYINCCFQLRQLLPAGIEYAA